MHGKEHACSPCVDAAQATERAGRTNGCCAQLTPKTCQCLTGRPGVLSVKTCISVPYFAGQRVRAQTHTSVQTANVSGVEMVLVYCQEAADHYRRDTAWMDSYRHTLQACSIWSGHPHIHTESYTHMCSTQHHTRVSCRTSLPHVSRHIYTDYCTPAAAASCPAEAPTEWLTHRLLAALYTPT